MGTLATALYVRTGDLLKESPHPVRARYNKHLRAAAGLMLACIRVLAASTSLWTDDVWVVDSTPVEYGRSRETAKRPALGSRPEFHAALPRYHGISRRRRDDGHADQGHPG
jgi:hypothetical protein